MNLPASVLAAAAGGYLLGSISFSAVMARAKGIDLRSIGSGNLGATNAGRALGWQAGLLVYLLDAAKGWVPAEAALRWDGESHESLLLASVAGGCAFLGHVWPVFHRFRGGKGVATLSGAALAIAPEALLWSALAFLLVVLATRFMSLGSLVLAVALPIAAWWTGGAAGAHAPVVVVLAVCGALVFYTHRANIRRLLQGTENRLGRKVV